MEGKTAVVGAAVSGVHALCILSSHVVSGVSASLEALSGIGWPVLCLRLDAGLKLSHRRGGISPVRHAVHTSTIEATNIPSSKKKIRHIVCASKEISLEFIQLEFDFWTESRPAS